MKKEQSKIIDLFDGELDDGTFVQIWGDKGWVTVSYACVTFSMPEENWKSFLKALRMAERNRSEIFGERKNEKNK